MKIRLSKSKTITFIIIFIILVLFIYFQFFYMIVEKHEKYSEEYSVTTNIIIKKKPVFAPLYFITLKGKLSFLLPFPGLCSSTQ